MGKSRHFMVVLSSNFSQRLKIPESFVKHIEKDFGKLHKGPLPVKLAGPTGRTWRVFIERAGSKTCFTRGWSNFAKDHVLKENEFLLFHYDGTEQFSTVVFDETKCERRNLMRKQRAKQALKVIPLPDSDSEWSSSGESNEEYDEEDYQEDGDDSDDCSYSAGSKRKKTGVSTSPHPPHSSSRKKRKCQYVSRRRAVTDSEKMKAFEAAFSFTSTKPYCLICMTANLAYCWSALRFPMRFSKEHLPKKRTKFVLKNSSGKEWSASYLLEGRHSTKGLISRGWTKFARENNIEEYDYCVFELVRENMFHVHIFRVVKQVVRPVWVAKE